MKTLCTHLLQPVRNLLGTGIRISSGYRSPELNAAIHGSRNSQHMKGEAADIETIGGLSNYALAQFIVNNFDFDQIILEFYTRGQPFSGWVHVSYKDPSRNRKSVLTAYKENGKTKYVNGLIK